MRKITAADGHQFNAHEAGNPNAPRALVVVQEIFGVNAHMRAVSNRLAAAGYHVLCPAIFDRTERDVELGYAPEDAQKGLGLRAAISEADVMADIEATAGIFAGKPVGIIGYCWGGTIAWWGATRSRTFKAAIGWYGGGIAATRHETPHCPVQLHFGEQDKGIPMADVEAIKAAHPQLPVFTYPGAQHGFGCEDRPSYNPVDCALAESRSLEFFAQHLQANL